MKFVLNLHTNSKEGNAHYTLIAKQNVASKANVFLMPWVAQTLTQNLLALNGLSVIQAAVKEASVLLRISAEVEQVLAVNRILIAYLEFAILF